MTATDGLMACAGCDALLKAAPPQEGEALGCTRCGRVFTQRRPGALQRALATLVAAFILMVVAVSFPFLTMERAGFENQISVLDAVAALWSADMHVLAVACGLLILVIPFVRLAALTFAIIALQTRRADRLDIGRALRLSSILEPWAMAEIFLFGVIVSLVKVGQAATISVGPSFWALAALVVALAYAQIEYCRHTTLWALKDRA